jgi:hypothetical protein
MYGTHSNMQKNVEKPFFASLTVWRIRDVYPGSDFFPSRIPDPNCLHPGSLSKNLSILTPKKAKNGFYAIKNMIRIVIPDPDADFLPLQIPDPGVKKAPNPGSGSATLFIRPTDE